MKKAKICAVGQEDDDAPYDQDNIISKMINKLRLVHPLNNDFFEDLDQETTKQIIENIKNNVPNKIGSQKGRKSSENA